MLKECSEVCDKNKISKADQKTLAQHINLIAHFTDDILETMAMYGAIAVNQAKGNHNDN